MWSLRAVVLWAAFAATVVVAGIMLLRACGLAVTEFGWNFCPLIPPALSAEAERGTSLARQARQLELELAQRNLDCASIPSPPPPPLELPTHSGRARPQQTALLKPPPPPPPPPEPPKPPPTVPADRWAQKDLTLLEGCWRLGRDGLSQLAESGPSGKFLEVCVVKTGTICFGRDGTGQREERSICPTAGLARCAAPITATFDSGGFLQTTQPRVMCDPPTSAWAGSPRNDLTCHRVSDDLVMCGGYEFRR